MRKLVTVGAFGGAAAAVAAAAVLAPEPGTVVDARNVASASTGWRITATPDANAVLGGLSVLSNNDAWAVGTAGYQQGTVLPLVRHWDGKSWTMVTALTTKDVYLGDVSASSASNVWISGAQIHGRNPRFCLLHWDGHQWSTQWPATPKSSAFSGSSSVLTFGPNDVWRFSSLMTDPSFTADVAHFDGRRWTKVKVPAPIMGTSAVSSHDIWATAVTCDGGACGRIVHWTGSTWSTSPQPPTTGNSAKYFGSYYTGIVARSAKDVWVLGSANAKAGPGKAIFLHWNGKSWAMLPVPTDNPQWRGLTDDGAGGFWASSISPSRSLYHYHAGIWRRIGQPAQPGLLTQMATMRRIPGTTSVWGVGGLSDPGYIDKSDAIFKFGP